MNRTGRDKTLVETALAELDSMNLPSLREEARRVKVSYETVRRWRAGQRRLMRTSRPQVEAFLRSRGKLEEVTSRDTSDMPTSSHPPQQPTPSEVLRQIEEVQGLPLSEPEKTWRIESIAAALRAETQRAETRVAELRTEALRHIGQRAVIIGVPPEGIKEGASGRGIAGEMLTPEKLARPRKRRPKERSA